MKISIFIWAASMVLFVVGCGSQGGTLTLTMDPQSQSVNTSGGDSSKPIMSQWVDATSGYYQVDLRNAKYNVNSTMIVNFITSESCTCSVLIKGTESLGAINISSCSGNSTYCSSFNIPSGNYAKSSANLLQVCDSAHTNCINLK